MGEAVGEASVAAAVRLERGVASGAPELRIARGAEPILVPRIAFMRPQQLHSVSFAPAPHSIIDQLPAREKAAFTLRLDPSRHARLKQACASSRRSAQQVVTDALDAFLAAAGGSALQPRPVGAAIRSGGF